jgi:hypothetical protein
LGAERGFGDHLVVDVELGGAVGLVAVADALFDELDAEDVLAGVDLAVGDELLLARDADDVVGVVELALLDEDRVAVEPCALGVDHASGVRGDLDLRQDLVGTQRHSGTTALTGCLTLQRAAAKRPGSPCWVESGQPSVSGIWDFQGEAPSLAMARRT